MVPFSVRAKRQTKIPQCALQSRCTGQGGSYEPVRLLVPNMFMNWLRNPGSLGFPHHTRTSNRSSRFTRVSEPKVRRVARNHYPGAIPLCRLQWIPLCFWPRPVRPLAPPAACDCRAPMPRPPLTDHRSHRLAVGALGCAGSRWGLGLVSPPQAAEPGHAQARVPSLPCRLCCRIPPPAPLISSPPVPRATHPPAAGRVRAGRSHDTQSPARGVRRGRGRCLAEKERAASLLG